MKESKLIKDVSNMSNNRLKSSGNNANETSKQKETEKPKQQEKPKQK